MGSSENNKESNRGGRGVHVGCVRMMCLRRVISAIVRQGNGKGGSGPGRQHSVNGQPRRDRRRIHMRCFLYSKAHNRHTPARSKFATCSAA